jgi:hypothetical protein
VISRGGCGCAYAAVPPKTSIAVTVAVEAEPMNRASMPVERAFLADMGCNRFIWELLAG